MCKIASIFLVFLCYFCVVFGQNSEVENQIRQGKLGFWNGATTMLTSLAQDIISRSAASSQVLSLNLTNLFILLVLKALIFGAGAFGYGHGGYGRSIDGVLNENLNKKLSFDEFLSESELLLMLSYMKADSTNNFECLQRVACEEPTKAKQYAFTGKLLLKTTEMFSRSINGSKYDNAISHIEEAINGRMKGENCAAKYKCEINIK